MDAGTARLLSEPKLTILYTASVPSNRLLINNRGENKHNDALSGRGGGGVDSGTSRSKSPTALLAVLQQLGEGTVLRRRHSSLAVTTEDLPMSPENISVVVVGVIRDCDLLVPPVQQYRQVILFLGISYEIKERRVEVLRVGDYI